MKGEISEKQKKLIKGKMKKSNILKNLLQQ